MTWVDIENFYTGLLTLLMDGHADSSMMTPEWDAFLTSALDRVLPTRYIYGGEHRYELRGFEVIQETGDGVFHSCGKLCDFERTAEKMTLIYKNGDHIGEHGERQCKVTWRKSLTPWLPRLESAQGLFGKYELEIVFDE